MLQTYLYLEHFNQHAALFCLTSKHQFKEDKWFQFQVQTQEIPLSILYLPKEGLIIWQILLPKTILAELLVICQSLNQQCQKIEGDSWMRGRSDMLESFKSQMARLSRQTATSIYNQRGRVLFSRFPIKESARVIWTCLMNKILTSRKNPSKRWAL